MADRYKCIQGHFTDKEHNGKSCPYDNMTAEQLSESLTEEIEEPKYQEKKIITAIKSNGSQTLTPQEWALWYKAVAENKALGYWSDTTEDGNAILTIENKSNHKIVITSGTFENPKANAVYSFSSSDEMNDYIEVLKIYDKK